MPKRLSVVVTRRAASEIAAAASWWEENRPAAPAALRHALAHAVELLRASPTIGVLAQSARLSGLRRILLQGVDYHLYYQADTKHTRITLIAFWHARRRPPIL